MMLLGAFAMRWHVSCFVEWAMGEDVSITSQNDAIQRLNVELLIVWPSSGISFMKFTHHVSDLVVLLTNVLF